MQFGGVVAVSDLTLDVNEGEIVALIGPNGAGKTTAFNVITGVYAPTNGRVVLRGETHCRGLPHRQDEKAVRRRAQRRIREAGQRTRPTRITAKGVARTFQNIRLFKDLTVFENVLIAKHLHVKANVVSATFRLNFQEEARIRRESQELIHALGLKSVMDEKSSSLPYGKQRVLEIVRALATNPSLLLLDEPAAGMNPQETDDLSDFIRKIKKEFKLTVFMIEHHMNLVMDISDRIYVIDFGKYIASGTPAQVQFNPDVIKAYLGVEEA